MHVTATELKAHLGQHVQDALKEDVVIEKSGRPVAVLVAYDRYQRLRDLEGARGGTWDDYFSGEPRVSDDFMSERHDPPALPREGFD